MADEDSGVSGSIASRLGISTEKVSAVGVSKFLKRQEPEHVEFVRHPNGYSIRVRNDEESINDAEQFWNEHIEERL